MDTALAARISEKLHSFGTWDQCIKHYLAVSYNKQNTCTKSERVYAVPGNSY
jgi:hypothetical protein